jgi:hypothetical protein
MLGELQVVDQAVEAAGTFMYQQVVVPEVLEQELMEPVFQLEQQALDQCLIVNRLLHRQKWMLKLMVDREEHVLHIL